MIDHLIFRLEAPIAAFGDLAVGERRGTARRPSHSAISGLMASALGLERADPRTETFTSGFFLAVRTDHLGSPFADFHTAQAPPQKRGRHYATRREELTVKTDLGTIVSRRDYWTDIAFTILIRTQSAFGYPLETLADALNRPAFPPFVGRRSCPLGAPVMARVVSASGVADAFAAYDLQQRAARGAGNLPSLRIGAEIALDAELWDLDNAGLTRRRLETRRDRPISRRRWQFELRREIVATLATAISAGDPA